MQREPIEVADPCNLKFQLPTLSTSIEKAFHEQWPRHSLTPSLLELLQLDTSAHVKGLAVDRS